VVVVGDALIDVLHDGSQSSEFVGGAALNIAVGLSVLGIPSALIAMVGDDRDGETIRRYLDEYGVGLLASPSEFGTMRAISERVDGEPRYTFNEAAKRKRIVFAAAERSAIAAASVVAVSCFPFDDDGQAAQLGDSIDNPRERLVLDPNPRAGMVDDRERFAANFERSSRVSLLTKISDEDAEFLRREPLEALRLRLLDEGASAVLATAGSGGASISTSRGVHVFMDIVPLPGPVVDTMGAGDAMIASSIASILRDGVADGPDTWRRLLEQAMTIAAATVRGRGALLLVP
jgi:fructokinase